MSVLRLEGISKQFGSVRALDGIDLEILSGSRTAIVGPSGSGKSTLLRIIAGFDTPDQGRVIFEDRCIADGSRSVPAHQRAIGVVSQDGSLFPHLDVAANIGFGMDPRAVNRTRMIFELMDMVELDRSMATRRPHELSGGQQQRVALARALARHPCLMVLDEPFSALDAGLREAMRHVVTTVLSKAGVTALLVTHDQAEALSFADRVAILREGRLVQYGTPRELYFAPRDPMAAAFLGDAVLLPARLYASHASCILGDVPVKPHGQHGMGLMMLRPEQIRLEPASLAGDQPTAQIIDVEFAGSICIVRIAVDSRDETMIPKEPLLRVKLLSTANPQPGDRVAVRVDGRGHLFAAE